MVWGFTIILQRFVTFFPNNWWFNFNNQRRIFPVFDEIADASKCFSENWEVQTKWNINKRERKEGRRRTIEKYCTWAEAWALVIGKNDEVSSSTMNVFSVFLLKQPQQQARTVTKEMLRNASSQRPRRKHVSQSIFSNDKECLEVSLSTKARLDNENLLEMRLRLYSPYFWRILTLQNSKQELRNSLRSLMHSFFMFSSSKCSEILLKGQFNNVDKILQVNCDNPT